jgi:hypothetical protein
VRSPVCLGLGLLAALCYGEAHAQAPTQLLATYHSDAMNLDFNYPASFASGKSAAAEKGCVSTPVATMDMRTGFNMIFLRRFDGACMRKEIAADRGKAAANFLKDTLEGLGQPLLGKGADYEIGIHPAYAVPGAVKLEGVKPAGTVVYGLGSCVVASKDLACFVFLSSDCRTLATISYSTLKFADSPAAPVIPSDIVLPCKL